MTCGPLGRLVLAVLCVVCASGFATADQLAPTEHELKAAFLYNFAKFVEWPADKLKDSSAFVLCILSGETYVSARDMLTGKSIKGRRLLVRQVNLPDDAVGCHLLFVGRNEMGRLQSQLDAIDPHVLRVGEASDFIRRGGVINLVRDANKFRFEINRNAGERVGFQFNYQLLQLAILVDGGR